MTEPSRPVELEEKIFRLVSTMVDRSPDDPLPRLVQQRLQARVDALHAELNNVRAASRATASAIQDAPAEADHPGDQKEVTSPNLTEKHRAKGRGKSTRVEPLETPSKDIEKKVKSMLPRGKRGKGQRRVWG